jgi:hypothetical protein
MAAQTNFDDYQEDLKRTADRIREQEINKKVYRIQADEDTGLWKIVSKGIPMNLIDDRFTVPTAAFRAIEMWEATQKPREEPRLKVEVVTENPYFPEKKKTKAKAKEATE